MNKHKHSDDCQCSSCLNDHEKYDDTDDDCHCPKCTSEHDEDCLCLDCTSTHKKSIFDRLKKKSSQ